MKLSDEDKSMIVYFIAEKGDVTRWCGWESVKPLVAAEYPELIDALQRVEIAVKTLAAVVATIK